MFADLGHFSYTAIQVALTSSFGEKLILSSFGSSNVVQCPPMEISDLPMNEWSLTTLLIADCFYLSGLSSTYIGLYGSSCLLVTASPLQPRHQFLCLSSWYTSIIHAFYYA